MVMPRWRRVLLGLGGVVLATTGGLGLGEAANCGDTAGPHRTRVPCACGDTVVTSTRLRATDPVVTTPCTASDDALTIGANNLTLDCRGLSISGGSSETALTVASALRGIFGERNGVTVQNCTVQSFIDGIELLGHRNRILNNVALGTFGGIVVAGDHNRIEGNRSENAFAEGLTVLEGRRNVVTHNRATNCFEGFVIAGERGWITHNVANSNESAGIVVDGNDNLLFGNTADRNGDGEGPQSGDGFLVDGTGNILIGNFARDNDAKGFCVIRGNIGVLNIAHHNGATPEADFDCPPP